MFLQNTLSLAIKSKFGIKIEIGVTDIDRQEDDSLESCSLQAMAEMDVSRKKLLLEFFADHFVAMADKSNEFKSYGQGKIR